MEMLSSNWDQISNENIVIQLYQLILLTSALLQQAGADQGQLRQFWVTPHVCQME